MHRPGRVKGKKQEFSLDFTLLIISKLNKILYFLLKNVCKYKKFLYLCTTRLKQQLNFKDYGICYF